MVNSLLTAIVRADGDALVMHVGERPYVVAAPGPVELSSRPLTLEAVTGMLGQLLPFDTRRALDELGAIEHELAASAAAQGDRFTVVAARGGDDIWIEVRRHRKSHAAAQPAVAPAAAATIAAAPKPVAAQTAEATADVGLQETSLPTAPAQEVTTIETRPEIRAAMPVEAAAPESETIAAPPTVVEPVAAPVSEPMTVAEPAPVAEPEAALAAAPAVAAEAPSSAPEPVVEPAPAATLTPDVMSFEALVDASLKAASAPAAPPPGTAAPVPKPPTPPPVRPAAPQSVVRPLVAAPIVERPPVDSMLFDRPVYPAPRDTVAVPGRQIAAALPESSPAVVLPLARNAVRMDVQTRTVAPVRVGGVDRLLRLAAGRGAAALYLMPQSRPSVRVDGEIVVLEGESPLSAQEAEALLLDFAPESTREALQAGEGTEWMLDLADVGRVRCQGFRDHRGAGGIFHLMSTRPTSAEQLGLAREVQAVCAESEGLILVAGPRASGKSTLVSSFVDLINRTRNDYVITIESQVKIVHESRGCLVSQREVRGGNDELAAAVRAAVRENPDVLVIDDMRSTEVVRFGLEAMEAGRLVIGGVSAQGAEPALAKLLGRAPMRLALAEGLRGVVSQVLVRKTGGGRVAAREILLNTPSVAKLIAEGRLNQLSLAIDAGRKHGMVPLNDALAAFVQSGVVDPKEAYRSAFERPAFLAALRREGIDTSFVERLA